MHNLLCFSHLSWNFVYQRPQHLLSRFANTYRVFYFEEPRIGHTDMYSVNVQDNVCIVELMITSHDPTTNYRIQILINQLLEEYKIKH